MNMGRYIQDVGIDKPFDVVSLTMEDYLYHHHFIRTDWEGEPVYCSKISSKECYLNWTYSCGILHIEAWIKNAFGNEADLDGAGKEKAEYKKSLTELIEKLRSHSGDPIKTGYIGHDPLHHQEANSYRQQGASAGADPYRQQGASAGADPYRQQGTSAGADPYRQQGTSAGTNPYQQGQPTYERPLNIGKRAFGNIADSQTKQLGILAIVFAIVFPAAGLVMAIIGLSKCKQEVVEDGGTKQAKTMCMIALGIAALRVVMPILFAGLTFFLSFMN